MDKKIVWKWDFMDHTCQSKNPAWPRYVTDVKDAPGKFDVHWMTDNQQPNGQAGFVSDWVHVNSVDFNDETGHVVINPKHFSDFIVVDHDKTFVSTTNFAANIAAAAGPDGDIIYRWGNPSSYNAGAAPGWMNEGDSQMYGSHNIQCIRPYHWQRPHLATDKWPDPATYVKSGVALPGAGNFLIFDNGCYNPTPNIGSRVLEINPRIGASGTEEVPKGQYIWPVVAGYKTATGNYQRKISKQTRLELPVHRAAELLQQPHLGHAASAERQHLDQLREPGADVRGDAVGEVVWQYQYPMAAIGPGGPIGAKLVATDSTNA